MRYFSMFTGIGGFEYGIEKAYAEVKSKDNSDSKGRTSQHNGCPLCIGYSEIDKYSIKTYETHYPNHKNYGDATINPEELPDFDMLCGGFPCQAFSIAGKRGGFDDTRGTLFFEIARVLERKRPGIVVLENVKGLLNHDGGNTFAKILQTLDELGYDVEWELLNSKNFGVPQNRERVFIIGHLRGTSGRQIFPLGCGSQATAGEDSRKVDIKQLNDPVHSNDRIYSDDGCSPSLNSMQGGRRQQMICVPELWALGSAKKGRKCIGAARVPEIGDSISPIRRLTPVECERLQGFPDNWTVGSDTQRYKQCGNAVTTNVVQAIFERIFERYPELV